MSDPTMGQGVRLTYIEPWSAAKLVGIMYAVMGLFFGAIFSLMSLATGALTSGMAGGEGAAAMAGANMLFGGCAVVALPIFYGVIGFLGTALMCWLYNVIAGRVGGVAVRFEP